jgi:hypothetical protein
MVKFVSRPLSETALDAVSTVVNNVLTADRQIVPNREDERSMAPSLTVWFYTDGTVEFYTEGGSSFRVNRRNQLELTLAGTSGVAMRLAEAVKGEDPTFARAGSAARMR